MNRNLRLIEPSASQRPAVPASEDRSTYVDDLRERYLAGTLDEVLIPEQDVPDRLLQELFPAIFGAPEDLN
jgi:hypothetical protein